MAPFNGSTAAWPRWKSRTQCAFDGSGYEDILTDREYAKRNPKRNKVVYSQLAVATVDGTAYHLIEKYQMTKDGNSAWKDLVSWYEGEAIKNETAEDIRVKLENTILHQGVSASHYINKFLSYHHDLERIPGEANSDSHAVYLFLKQIVDKDYVVTVQYLRNTNAPLGKAILALRKAERDLENTKSNRRKLRNILRRQKDEIYSDEESASELTHRPKRQKTDYMTEFTPNKNSGKLGVHPAE